MSVRNNGVATYLYSSSHGGIDSGTQDTCSGLSMSRILGKERRLSSFYGIARTRNSEIVPIDKVE